MFVTGRKLHGFKEEELGPAALEPDALRNSKVQGAAERSHVCYSSYHLHCALH